MKEPFKSEEGANVDGTSDNDYVGCDDEQEGKRKQRKEERKEERKEGRKDGWKEEIEKKDNNF